MKICSLFLLCSLFAIPVDAAISFDISHITVKDSETLVERRVSKGANNLNWPITFSPTQDLDLISFESGGQVYDAGAFFSGLAGDAVINTGLLNAVVQPEHYRANNPTHPYFANSTISAGNPYPNAADYLVTGERGLSFSTALNFIGQENRVLEFGMTFLADPVNSSVPVFCAGDSADNQSVDTWRFLDASGNLVASFVSIDADDTPVGTQVRWNEFAKLRSDRLNTEDSSSNGTGSRDMSLMAFSLENADFEPGKTYQDVAKLEISMATAKTDWAFIGINMNLVQASSAVVPEPRLSLYGIALLFFVGVRKRRQMGL